VPSHSPPLLPPLLPSKNVPSLPTALAAEQTGIPVPPHARAAPALDTADQARGTARPAVRALSGYSPFPFTFRVCGGILGVKKANEARHATIRRHKRTCGFAARRIRDWSVRRINVARHTVCSLRNWEIEEEANVRG